MIRSSHLTLSYSLFISFFLIIHLVFSIYMFTQSQSALLSCFFLSCISIIFRFCYTGDILVLLNHKFSLLFSSNINILCKFMLARCILSVQFLLPSATLLFYITVFLWLYLISCFSSIVCIHNICNNHCKC